MTSLLTMVLERAAKRGAREVTVRFVGQRMFAHYGR